MTIKTYRGRTPGEALARVKRELGSDAVILHTKTGRAGGVWGIGSRTWTEITATGGKGCSVKPVRAGSRVPGSGGEAGRARAASAQVERRDIVELIGAAAGQREGRGVGRGVEARAEQRGERRGEGTRQAGSSGGYVSRDHEERGSAAGAEAGAGVGESEPTRLVARAVAGGAGFCAGSGGARTVEQEIALIRRMVGQVLQSSRGSAVSGAMPQALEECYLRLLDAEVASEIADDVVGRVRDELSPEELGEPLVVRETVLRRLASLIPVHDEPVSTARPADGRPRTIALVGPTGVGKTTTIAKLAATYKLRLRKRVGLVTSDTYRIAAVDQLRTYANIIGLPLEVTLTPAEMSRAVRSLSECDVILIDTAGRSQHDAHRVEELRSFVDAAGPHETHLVLSSTAGEPVLRRASRVFGSVNPTHVIFTKLDEAVNFGVLVNVIRSVDARLSFVTTGQEVPDQIERGNAERLARLVLGGDR